MNNSTSINVLKYIPFLGLFVSCLLAFVGFVLSSINFIPIQDLDPNMSDHEADQILREFALNYELGNKMMDWGLTLFKLLVVLVVIGLIVKCVLAVARKVR